MTDTRMPPEAIMMQMINGKLVSRCISIVADLGIADRLEEGSRDVATLADACGVSPDPLYRVLRTLAGLGVFTETADREFANTPLSGTLRSDVPGAVRHYARWLGTPLHWQAVSDMDYSVRTGTSALIADGRHASAFEALAADATAQETFNDAMTELSSGDGPLITQSYDFTRFDRIVDVGGGHAQLARAIAEAAPKATIKVLDLPHVVEGTNKRLEADSLGGRIQGVAGSFLERVPGPVDLCFLKHVLHNWDDATATSILNHCRDALADGGRVAACEFLVSPGPEGMTAKVLDIEMLLGPGGRERTEEEFRELFASAGLKLAKVYETPGPQRILEAAVP